VMIHVSGRSPESIPAAAALWVVMFCAWSVRLVSVSNSE
jgi:hypothetical protein